MLLRASLGMAIAIFTPGVRHQRLAALFILRAVMGLTSGYIPNAMALVASQVPRERSGWALSTLSTAQISGVIGGAAARRFPGRSRRFARRYLSSPRFC